VSDHPHYTDPAEAGRASRQRADEAESYRQYHPDSELVDDDTAAGQVIDQHARELAQADPAFAPALAAHNAGMWIVPLGRDARPLRDLPPTRSLADLVQTWQQHPGSPAGVACGQRFGVAGLRLDGRGWEWLTRKLTTAPPEQAPVTRTDVISWADERPRSRPAVVRDPAGLVVQLLERMPAAPRLTMRPLEGGQDRREPKRERWLCWAWPAAGTLPKPGRIAGGVELLAAVPADGAVVELDGTVYIVQVGGWGRLLAMPEYVVEALGGKAP
jgi:hypothetical protein